MKPNPVLASRSKSADDSSTLAYSASTERILVRGVNWLGDAVMTTPALQRLRAAFPQAQITLLTPEKLAELWKHAPGIDGIVTFAPGESPFSIGRRLRPEKFHRALVFPNSPRSALEVWLARIPERIGYSRPWRNWFMTRTISTRPGHLKMRKRSDDEIHRLIRQTPSHVKDPSPGSPEANSTGHQMLEYLHLAAILGANPAPIAPALHVTDEERAAVAARFGWASRDPSAATDVQLVGLNPGAEYGPAKRWPAERFVAVALEIQRRLNCRCVIFGGSADAELARDICQGIQSGGDLETASPLNLAGKTSLRELMALLSFCRVLLSNDTGPMHVAAALGTPVVTPFGSTSPELTGPGLPNDSRHRLLKSKAPCSPCFRRACPIDFRCMTGISVEAVVEAIVQISAGKRS
jgi:heptosyltransferase-2